MVTFLLFYEDSCFLKGIFVQSEIMTDCCHFNSTLNLVSLWIGNRWLVLQIWLCTTVTSIYLTENEKTKHELKSCYWNVNRFCNMKLLKNLSVS